jgi:hypothetical protein
MLKKDSMKKEDLLGLTKKFEVVLMPHRIPAGSV